MTITGNEVTFLMHYFFYCLLLCFSSFSNRRSSSLCLRGVYNTRNYIKKCKRNWDKQVQVNNGIKVIKFVSTPEPG